MFNMKSKIDQKNELDINKLIQFYLMYTILSRYYNVDINCEFV